MHITTGMRKACHGDSQCLGLSTDPLRPSLLLFDHQVPFTDILLLLEMLSVYFRHPGSSVQDTQYI